MDDIQPPPVGRARSQSVASAQPSVETVVTKAKRAAESLWLLLHSQSCALGPNCPYQGCREAKKVHLHLKSCPANVSSRGQGCSCPTGYNGCEQARMLLAHYKRCRSVRAKNTGRSESTVKTCLVCSLMARQARSTLDPRGKSRKNPKNGEIHIMAPPPPRRLSPPPPRRRLLSSQKIANESSVQVFRSPKLDTRHIACTIRVEGISGADLTAPTPPPSADCSLEGTEFVIPVPIERRPRASSVALPAQSDNGRCRGRSRSLSVGGSVSECATINEGEELE